MLVSTATKRDGVLDFPGKHKQNYFTLNARTGLRTLLASTGTDNLNVGVQVYTCHTVFQAIKKAGHNIIFIDINEKLGIDIDDLDSKKDEIDVLIVTHTFGFPDNIPAIKEIIGDTILIEDCAHSFLSEHSGNYTGGMGDASFFSFGTGKFPPIGSGGLIIVNRPENFPAIEDEYSQLPENSILISIVYVIRLLLYSIFLHAPAYGLISFRMGKKLDQKLDLVNKFSFKEGKGNGIFKKFLLNNGEYFRYLVDNNRKMTREFYKDFKEFAYPIPDDINPNYYIVPLLLKNRDSVYDYLLQNNIETGKHFHKSIEWAREFGYRDKSCPSAEVIISKILTIPLHSGVSKKKYQRIKKHLSDILTIQN